MPLIEKIIPAISEKREMICPICGRNDCDGKQWWYQEDHGYCDGPSRHVVCSHGTQFQACRISLKKIDKIEGVPSDVINEMRKKVPQVRYTESICVSMCCYNSWRLMEYTPKMGKLWESKGWKKTKKHHYYLSYETYRAIYKESVRNFYEKIHTTD